MASIPDKARSRRGRAIQPTYEALEDFVDDYEVTPGGHYRTSTLPGQTLFRANRAPGGLRHPFKVLASGAQARVREGMVNGVTPRMGREGKKLDGELPNGDKTGVPPVLGLLDPAEEFGAPGPGEDGRSFICVRALISLVTGAPEFDVPDWLRVVNRRELPEGFESGGMPEVLEAGWTVGYWPLAVLYWDAAGKGVQRTRQFTHFNLQHRYLRHLALGIASPAPGEEGEENLPRGRHWFGP